MCIECMEVYLNKVTLGDCLELMTKIPDNSIDMVCTDPPYFLDGLGSEWNKRNWTSAGRLRTSKTYRRV